MDLKTEALLFQTPTSRVRRNFTASYFVEKSTKLGRLVRIYTNLADQIWLNLESDPHVVDYNEAPKTISIANGSKVFQKQFRFSVRRDDGTIQVISTMDEIKADKEEVEGAEDAIEFLNEEEAIRVWANSQDIEYLLITKDSIAGNVQRLANLRLMLKFIETAHQCRYPEVEETIENTIRKLAPVQIRRVIEHLPTLEETLIIALIARNILSEHYCAPIDKRDFDGALVIDLGNP
jgi:hypothetical protein